MAFRPSADIKAVDLTRLHSQLITSQLNQKDQPLFQVIDALIQQSQFLTKALTGLIPGINALGDKTFITNTNETSTLPNSKQIVAGDHIEFDESNPGQLIINSVPFDLNNPADAIVVVELFRYTLKRLDLIEKLIGIDRTIQDILVPFESLEVVQEGDDSIGIASMK